MASLLFLQLVDESGSPVKGEVEVESHLNWIEIEGCNWDMKQRDEPDGTVKGNANFANPGTFGFSKFPDSSSTRMMQAQVDRVVYKSARFHLYEELQGDAGDTGGIFDLTITLRDVRVTSYKLSGSNDDKAVTLKEDWEFDYGDITFEHRNAGANVVIEKPRSPDKAVAEDAESPSRVRTPTHGGTEGTSDFLTPLGSV